MSELKKPKLRGHHNRQFLQSFIGGFAMGLVGAAVVYFTNNLPRRLKYAQFYENYDAEKEFKKMAKLNLFQSGKPDDADDDEEEDDDD